jgi:KDO2-lipid IV(A) lauroyltransferase
MLSGIKLWLRRLRWRAKQVFSPVVGWTAVGMLRAARMVDRKKTANFFGWFMRNAGPRLKEHRIGRDNLAAAFPERSRDEIERILAAVWDNLGRVAAEFAHLDRLTIAEAGGPGGADIAYNPVASAQIADILRSGRPRVFFAAHLANWELPALIAQRMGLDITVLYRPPNLRAVSDAVLKIRAGCMGTLVPSGFDAPIRLAKTLERGGHVGMLVDQHETRGLDVTFFGRTCKVSPLIAQLARHLDCPIQGIRIVRQADRNTFWGEITEPIAAPRDAGGRIDVPGTMQAITAVVESWAREHPEQWLWLHRRWR